MLLEILWPCLLSTEYDDGVSYSFQRSFKSEDEGTNKGEGSDNRTRAPPARTVFSSSSMSIVVEKAAAGGPPPPLGGNDDDAPCPKAKDGGAFGMLLPFVVNDDRTVGPDESKGSSNESSAIVAFLLTCLVLACEVVMSCGTDLLPLNFKFKRGGPRRTSIV